MMALSHDRHPLGPMLFSGPLQPPTQFSWHDRHSPLSLYLLAGHSGTQYGPSLTFLHAVQLPGPGPVHVSEHSSWQRLHSFGVSS